MIVMDHNSLNKIEIQAFVLHSANSSMRADICIVRKYFPQDTY